MEALKEKLSHDLWNERGYDYKYLNSLSVKELNALWDTEFYLEKII